jgi:hypothetical protein
MNSRQEMEDLLKVESLLNQATRRADYLDRRIILEIGDDNYLILHDCPGRKSDSKLDEAKKACMDKIIDALKVLKLELCGMVRDDLDCYLECFTTPPEPEEPDVNNEAPLCECGEPTCNGTCYHGQNPE